VTAISTGAQPVRDEDRGPAGGWAARLLRGRPTDPAWARPALLALLAATALLYLAGLSRNGWANDFYAAAVQAGATSWKAFLFGSFDSANFITVDKTPASLWVMDLSVRVFGLNYWSLLVPQALEGVATVGVLYTTVRRWFGAPAALIAGAVMALTPVATLMFRYNNPDSLLVLIMVLAAYTTTRALESGRTRWLTLTGALLGLGFLTKMLQAFLVLPVFALAYLVAGPPRLGQRIWQLLAGGAALLVAAGWWVALVMLTPAADRPYIGGSTNNSILQLTFGYNGFGRLDGNEVGSVGFGNGAGPQFGGSASLTRLFGAEMGGQVSWLIPAALVALAALLWLSRRSPRTDRTRSAAILWGGWLVVTGLVFSYMSGIIHPYYTVALAPAVGALTGIGAAALWRDRRTVFARVAMAAMLAVRRRRSWPRGARSLRWRAPGGGGCSWPRFRCHSPWPPGSAGPWPTASTRRPRRIAARCPRRARRSPPGSGRADSGLAVWAGSGTGSAGWLAASSPEAVARRDSADPAQAGSPAAAGSRAAPPAGRPAAASSRAASAGRAVPAGSAADSAAAPVAALAATPRSAAR
jgi:4-amino-4-deoxy-L-arabinose transferase-like glycosyltransferase